MFKWLAKRRKTRNKEVADMVCDRLSSSNGWEKFLPPVTIHNKVYMVTENGSIYRMHLNNNTNCEIVTRIRRR